MSTKFFTNQDGNTLLKKFEGIFEHTQVSYFDALVGFFYASGYFRVRDLLNNVSEIRILVGIEVDKMILEAARKNHEFNFNAESTREEFIKELRGDIQKAEYSKDVEDGIIEFVNDVASGRIKIKAHPSKRLHSKIYIFRPKNYNEHNSGYVITGSSNLTAAGLENNFEFNVELRDYADVAFAHKTFEELWKEGIEISAGIVLDTKSKTYLNDSFTPFEVYVKFLIEYFGTSIEYDPESVSDLPDGFMKLHYQIDAVNQGYKMLVKHNGFFLSDVVGLGKTIIATIIARKFYFSNGYRTKTLIIYPPALETNWKNIIRRFEVPNVDFISNGSIHKVKHPEDYDLIIVDEAHKFRSDESEMFHQLQKLCKTPRKRPGADGSRDKKVMLVTATPLNNRPADIRNQLYLFLDSKHSSLTVGNLQHFFRDLIDDYDELKKEKNEERIKSEVKRIYTEIRTKLLEEITVRRTRTDILNVDDYKNDIKAQGLSFPSIVPPRKILYQLDDGLNTLYDHTIDLLKGKKNGLGYYRYQAIRFLPKDVQNNLFNRRAETLSDQLAIIMRTLLVKRIDSSFHAFKKSLRRYYDANTAMLKMIENGRIYIAPKLGVNEYVLQENTDELERIMMDGDSPHLIQAFSIDDFDKEFIEGIHKDQAILEKLKAQWEEVTQDPKYDEFIHRIKTELFDKTINREGKLVIFSESKETTDHIVGRMKEDGFSRILAISSSNVREMEDVIGQNFDANLAIKDARNDYDIVFTTEVLAEGVNLHRSNVILNYDTPWNATRLMQRIGRVNRIGTASDKIYIYNFFPTEKTDKEIELEKKAFLKLQGFHTALGEDSQIYSTKEEYGSFGLFERIPEEDRDERLIYLNWLRRLSKEQPELFKRIKDTVPKRARTGRKDKLKKQSTITYIRNNKRDGFFYIHANDEIEELTFLEAVKIFEAHEPERSVPLHDNHHNQVNAALGLFRKEENIAGLGTDKQQKLGPNETNALSLVANMLNLNFASDEEMAMMTAARVAIKKGRFQKLPRQINKLMKESVKEKTPQIEKFKKLIQILSSYPLTQSETIDINDEDYAKPKPETPGNMPNIIISESFSI